MTLDRSPHPDADSAPFFAGLDRRVVVVQVCDSCARPRFGRLDGCPYCGALGWHDREFPGTGTVYSFVRVHRALTAEMADEVPYVVGTITLDVPDGPGTGPRMLGRVEPEAAVAIGVGVRPAFVAHPTWTELRFEVVE